MSLFFIDALGQAAHVLRNELAHSTVGTSQLVPERRSLGTWLSPNSSAIDEVLLYALQMASERVAEVGRDLMLLDSHLQGKIAQKFISGHFSNKSFLLAN